jgi:hypothetical protein
VKQQQSSLHFLTVQTSTWRTFVDVHTCIYIKMSACTEQSVTGRMMGRTKRGMSDAPTVARELPKKTEESLIGIKVNEWF